MRSRAELMFAGHLGRPPQGVNVACGRVIVLGEELDAEHERLLVIPTRETVACAWAIRPDDIVVAWDMNKQEMDTFHQGHYERTGRGWSDLVRGACAHLAEGKRRLPGLDLMLLSDLPRDEGLGFDTAYLVTLLRSLYEAIGEYRSKWELAEVVPGIRWEWNEADGSPLDTYLVAAAKPGQVLGVDCKELDHEVLPLPEGWELVPEPTGHPRRLPSSRYFARQLELSIAGDEARGHLPEMRSWHDLGPGDLQRLNGHLSDPGRRRARHVVTEAQRVRDALRALRAGDMSALGAVLVDGHRSLAEDWESTEPEIDAQQQEAMRRPDVQGAVVQGLGWGGPLAVLRKTA